MLLDVRGRERTEGRHLEASVADQVQGARNQSTSHTMPFELVADLGVDKDEPAWSLTVVEPAGQSPVDASLEPVLVGIVDDLDGLAGHERNPTSR